MKRNAGMLVCWDKKMLGCWNTGMLECKKKYWDAGMLVCWYVKRNTGMLECKKKCWDAGILGFWNGRIGDRKRKAKGGKVMRTFLAACIVCLVLAGSAWGFGSFSDSPTNFENSGANFENSPLKFENSPLNLDNSPLKMNNNRIIRNNQGQPMGYIVPKDNGGANVFDMQGNREGYVPSGTLD